MDQPELDPALLAQEALASAGFVRLATLLTGLLTLTELREVAKRFNLAPKGFRLEKAAAPAVAALLAECALPEVLDEVCARLAKSVARPKTAPPPPTPVVPAPDPLAKHREEEGERLRAEVARARAATAGHRDGEARLRQELEQERASSARLRATVRELRERRPGESPAVAADDAAHRVHDLERELAELDAANEELRRRVAELQARARQLEQENEELGAQVPKGKRKKKEPPPPPPPLDNAVRLPYFSPSFYKSLEGKDRRAAARALQGVLLFCTEGPTYPGLEVKRLEGAGLWSLRASLKLRVYFTLRDDGTVEVLELGDREEQHTALRRLKER